MSKNTATRINRKSNLFDKKLYGEVWETYKKEHPLTGKVCTRCGSAENLERHHIIPVSKKGRHVEANVSVRCATCHELLHRHMQRKKK